MIATTALPSSQRNDSMLVNSSMAVVAAELLLFKAAMSVYMEKEDSLVQEWDGKEGEVVKLYSLQHCEIAQATGIS